MSNQLTKSGRQYSKGRERGVHDEGKRVVSKADRASMNGEAEALQQAMVDGEGACRAATGKKQQAREANEKDS